MSKTPKAEPAPTEEFEARLIDDLARRYGPIVGGADLMRVLGYRTLEAMRQAVKRGAAPIPIFALPKRKGRFALTVDAAVWMARCRDAAVAAPDPAQHPVEPTTPREGSQM